MSVYIRCAQYYAYFWSRVISSCRHAWNGFHSSVENTLAKPTATMTIAPALMLHLTGFSRTLDRSPVDVGCCPAAGSRRRVCRGLIGWPCLHTQWRSNQICRLIGIVLFSFSHGPNTTSLRTTVRSVYWQGISPNSVVLNKAYGVNRKIANVCVFQFETLGVFTKLGA